MIHNRFVLIDAFALIHRAYHAIPASLTRDGHPINAAYGFTSALLSAIRVLEPEYLATGFDLPKPTFRKKEYVEYKAHRAAPPEDFVSQIPYVKEVLRAFNIPIICAEGYEGEDAIASAIAKIRSTKSEARNKSKILKNNNSNSFEFRISNFEFIIVTGDMDTLQLIDSQTKVYSMARGVNLAQMYDEKKVIEKYGFEPIQMVDYKALRGDPSDNIPGVPGIGEKTASSLIKQFGTLDALYQAISNFEFQISSEFQNNKNFKNKTKISEKIIRLLLENKEQAFLSQKLAKIVNNAPIEFELSDAKVHDFDYKKVTDLFNKLGFKSLIPRLPKSDHKKLAQSQLL